MPFQPRLAMLVPAADYEEDWRPAYARKVAALAATGLAVEPRDWTAPGDLSGFDLILPLFAWGYQRDVAAWYALLDAMERQALPVVNAAPLLRWNSDKAYLAELGARGVAVVPTVDVPALDATTLGAARAALGGGTMVVKPAISGGADGTYLLTQAADIPGEAFGQRRLVQPLMPGINRVGEASLFYFGGRFSHAILKRPAAGDFRVQAQFGGQETAWTPDGDALALAAAALDATPHVPVYARVDMVPDAAGAWRIMELELIEPSLFLHFAPDRGAAFAAAISRAVATATA